MGRKYKDHQGNEFLLVDFADDYYNNSKKLVILKVLQATERKHVIISRHNFDTCFMKV